MPAKHAVAEPFAVKDCALIAIATGKRAQTLREMRDCLASIDAASIYYHFWGGLLRPKFVDPEYNNDFAAWARHALHDSPLAERLGVIDPTAYDDLEALRAELLDVVETRLDDSAHVPWSEADQQLSFVRSQIVVFDTARRIERPEALSEHLPQLSLGSVFYHFIDARRRNPERYDDFRRWLERTGDEHAGLWRDLAAVDYYFVPLSALRAQLAELFGRYFALKVVA